MKMNSLMRGEIAEIPAAVARAVADPDRAIARAGQALNLAAPAFLGTVARGSSDHAALYLSYAAALTCGIATASLPPSVTSVFGRPLRLSQAAVLAVSQSGRSPDIVETATAAGSAGAITLALTNDPQSPLALSVAHPLSIAAGPERSVAATKTFVTSVGTGLRLIAHWQDDQDLHRALDALPDHLARAVAFDWPEFRAALAEHGPSGQRSVYVLGRGPSLAIANEAALKFKETCQIHAEGYSSAEVMHGPVSIVDTDFPVLVFAARDASEAGITAAADDLARKGAQVFATTDRKGAYSQLDFVATGHPLTDPLCLIASFYAMVERLAVEAEINPDLPRHLRKVTETR